MMFAYGLWNNFTDGLQRIASRCSVSLVAGSVHARCYWWLAADCLAVQCLVGFQVWLLGLWYSELGCLNRQEEPVGVCLGAVASPEL